MSVSSRNGFLRKIIIMNRVTLQDEIIFLQFLLTNERNCDNGMN